ncbi:MAG: DUF2147 domain-containing protein [Bacteroidota bacterium]
MKTKLLYTTLLLLSALSHGQDQKDAIQGFWLNHEKNAIVEIYEEGNIYYGRIHEVLAIPDEKSKALTAEQRQKGKAQMKGKLVLTDLTFKKDKWMNGKILNPKDNSTRASCTAYLENANNDLNLRIKKGFLSATKVWTRVEDNALADEK